MILKKIENPERINGQPESVGEQQRADAAREAHSAELVAKRMNVDKVYMGKEADRFINGKLDSGKMSCDTVGVTKDGKYILSEAKGANIEHGIEQLKHSADQLGLERVVRYEMVIPERLQVGYIVKNGILMHRVFSGGSESYVPYSINGKPVYVTHTTVR